ncbi:hypothetical protein BMI90_12720 [Thioclava sp. L04-15]|uniref:hypothetical protein n=1 Tax=Thioclava sp. L04-15 TaxID=1915318 RepID=UPI0009979C4B|nr:hypothetical protein [Thioclava sp. L04-15]OOY27466.1 hypothetical protein BMI90_12720 [Thioclava sp. L04-15]TNE92492.1 MAG: hypothetical protein EP337_05350 [Paracoccaceae bacterium]
MVENTSIEQDVSAGDPAEFDNDIYAKLTVSARLRDIKLISSDYSVKPEVFEALEDLENMVHGFSGEPSGFYFDEETGLLIGQYRWNAEIKLGRKKVLKLVSEYLVAYNGMADFDEGYVRFFFEKVGRFATYPYFRAEFSQHSSASGIMLPPLPSLNERVD